MTESKFQTDNNLSRGTSIYSRPGYILIREQGQLPAIPIVVAQHQQLYSKTS